MALVYADGAWELDGEAATEAEVIAFRDDQTEAWADELGVLAADELGDGEEPQQAIEFPIEAVTTFAAAFLARIGEITTAAYVFARGGVSAVPTDGWTVVTRLIERQVEYGRGFVASLRAGDLSSAQAVARARLYAGAAVEAFERGRMAQVGFDAPGWPTADCKGMTNCRCWWAITEYDDRFEGTWRAVGDKETCNDCAEHAKEWAPYTQRK